MHASTMSEAWCQLSVCPRRQSRQRVSRMTGTAGRYNPSWQSGSRVRGGGEACWKAATTRILPVRRDPRVSSERDSTGPAIYALPT